MAITKKDGGVPRDDLIDAGLGDRGVKHIDKYSGLVNNIPVELLTIDIKIGDLKLKTNLRDVLYYGRDNVAEQEDQEIDKCLDASSEYRVSIGIAYAHLKCMLEELEHKHYIFEVEEMGKAMGRITQKKYDKMGKLTAYMLEAKKEEKIQEIFVIPTVKAHWDNNIKMIRTLKRDIEILRRVDDVLKDRTTLLMGISKRRFQERTNTRGD